MKKRIVKKQFNKIAKKAIKENSYLFKKYDLYNTFINALNNYLDFILNANCVKQEIHFIGNIKLYLNNCIEDTEDYIYNRILNIMIHD